MEYNFVATEENILEKWNNLILEKSDSLASIYLGAAALSPVLISPKFPWVSINILLYVRLTKASPIDASP